ncbi:protein kinase [Streptomyces sp. NBC_00878]|uniref:serine/threonine-protein kinase n=1 Tax=Streptomyces sp. NBC_00878 TaxID=2975854 RepID=UPI002258E599|nr:protein kinase [Streptomyces sp. NBC_00878]MCX4904535.1 protein kinase [Streptomyces sp. NBC_00878]
MPTPLTHDDPTTLGPYRLVARLGSGGMGTVYMARTAGGRTVALKTMHAGIATDPAARTRFRLEVDAARVIGDRFGARVMEADPLGETPWMATEFVLGPALDEAVRSGGPLPERSVRALGAALCSALDQLHRSDVVHRDLKPSNILVTAYGPKVIDFGIARAIGDDRLTRTGASVGTPAFMSPEQATGKAHDAAGDVFALAGVLVYAATARPPFGHGQPADLLYRVRYADADLRGVPAPLVPVLARCLAKEPEKRPGLAELTAQLHDGTGEFAEHLPDALLAQIGRRAADVWRIVPERLAAPAVEASASAVTALPGPGPSRRGLLTAVGALAVTAAAGGMWWQRGRATATVSEVTQQTRNLDPLWQHDGDDLDVLGWGLVEPHQADGSIWLPLNTTAKRLDPTTGRVQREVRTSVNWWQAAVRDGRLYLLDHDFAAKGESMSIDVWNEGQDRAGPTSTSLADATFPIKANQLLRISDGVAYVAAGYGEVARDDGFLPSQTWTLRAADLRTGKTRWTQPLPRRASDSRRLNFPAAKAVGDHLVTFQVLAEQQTDVVVRDTRSGEALWDMPYNVNVPEALRSELAMDDKYLYLGGSQLQARRLSDGTQAWATELGQIYGPPTLSKGVLYTVGSGIGLTAVDAERGKVLWTETTNEADEAYTIWRPVLGTRHAYYKNGLQLRAVSLADHAPVLTYRTTGTQFYEFAQARLILAVDKDQLAAYPLR